MKRDSDSMTATVAHLLLGVVGGVSASAVGMSDERFGDADRARFKDMLSERIDVLTEALRCLASGLPDAALAQLRPAAPAVA